MAGCRTLLPYKIKNATPDGMGATCDLGGPDVAEHEPHSLSSGANRVGSAGTSAESPTRTVDVITGRAPAVIRGGG
jgi:hypothetical protein